MINSLFGFANGDRLGPFTWRGNRVPPLMIDPGGIDGITIEDRWDHHRRYPDLFEFYNYDSQKTE